MKYRMWIALCVALLGACSDEKKSTESRSAGEAPKAGELKADDSRATAAGLGELVKIKDEACACPDEACAEAVAIKLGNAIKEQVAAPSDPQQFVLLTNDAGKCLRKWKDKSE